MKARARARWYKHVQAKSQGELVAYLGRKDGVGLPVTSRVCRRVDSPTRAARGITALILRLLLFDATFEATVVSKKILSNMSELCEKCA